jgi:hypothetical protein
MRCAWSEKLMALNLHSAQDDFETVVMTAVRNTLLDTDPREVEAIKAEVENLRQRYAVLERRCAELLGDPKHVSNFLE